MLDVAERVFADEGYSAASIELIAREAGISRPIVYEHFGSKDGIYLACVQRARERLETELFEAVAGVDDLSTRLERGIDAIFAFIERNPRPWAVLFSGVAVSGPMAEEMVRMRFGTVDAIADLLDAASPTTPREEVEAFAHALSGAGEQVERWWRRNPDIPRERVVEYLHRFAWSGVSQFVTPVKRRRR